MKGFLWRAIIAVICVLILFALLPALFRIFGIPFSGDVETVIRVCVGGIALLYVFVGPALPAPWGP
jgi:hypothetical protein